MLSTKVVPINPQKYTIDIFDIKIMNFIHICNGNEIIFANFIFTIRHIKNIKLHAITGPIINPIIKLLKTKYMFNVLN